jgi:hypothetical protein
MGVTLVNEHGKPIGKKWNVGKKRGIAAFWFNKRDVDSRPRSFAKFVEHLMTNSHSEASAIFPEGKDDTDRKR